MRPAISTVKRRLPSVARTSTRVSSYRASSAHQTISQTVRPTTSTKAAAISAVARVSGSMNHAHANTPRPMTSNGNGTAQSPPQKGGSQTPAACWTRCASRDLDKSIDSNANRERKSCSCRPPNADAIVCPANAGAATFSLRTPCGDVVSLTFECPRPVMCPFPRRPPCEPWKALAIPSNCRAVSATRPRRRSPRGFPFFSTIGLSFCVRNVTATAATGSIEFMAKSSGDKSSDKSSDKSERKFRPVGPHRDSKKSAAVAEAKPEPKSESRAEPKPAQVRSPDRDAASRPRGRRPAARQSTPQRSPAARLPRPAITSSVPATRTCPPSRPPARRV